MGGQLAVALFDKTASNPAAHIGQAIAALRRAAPDVTLHACTWRPSTPSSAA
jgi:hypothetical protein